MTRDLWGNVRAGDLAVYGVNERGAPSTIDQVVGVAAHDGLVEVDWKRHPHTTIPADRPVDVEHR